MLQQLYRLWNDRCGSVLMIAGVAFVVLVAAGGAGYDFGRQQLVRLKLQQASDAAALAGGGLVGIDDAVRSTTATSFFNLNFPESYLGVARPAPSVRVAHGESVTVSATTDMPTAFITNLGITKLDIASKSVVLIQTATNRIDLILAMDNSGSMYRDDVGGTNFLSGDKDSMVAACVREMGGAEQKAYFMGYAKVPPNGDYSPYCNAPIPAAYDQRDWGYTGLNRLNVLRYVADKSAQQLLGPDKNEHRIAIVKWDNVLVDATPFTGNYSTVRTALMSMFAGGGTRSMLGLQKAAEFANDARPDAVTAIVLLTDGKNEPDPAIENPASIAICNTLKAKPSTQVFTIAFGTEVNTPMIRDFLSECATPPTDGHIYFYAAPDAKALEKAFADIIGSLQKVRIVE